MPLTLKFVLPYLKTYISNLTISWVCLLYISNWHDQIRNRISLINIFLISILCTLIFTSLKSEIHSWYHFLIHFIHTTHQKVLSAITAKYLSNLFILSIFVSKILITLTVIYYYFVLISMDYLIKVTYKMTV